MEGKALGPFLFPRWFGVEIQGRDVKQIAARRKIQVFSGSVERHKATRRDAYHRAGEILSSVLPGLERRLRKLPLSRGSVEESLALLPSFCYTKKFLPTNTSGEPLDFVNYLREVA